MKKLLLVILFALISSYSAAQPVISIFEAKQNDANGVPLLLGQTIRVSGVVSVANEFHGPTYFQDGTGGIAIYDSSVSNHVQYGDSIVVTGLVTHYNGLEELTTATNFQILSTGHTINPVVVTLTQFTNQSFSSFEEYDCILLRFNNLTTTSTGNFVGNTNYPVTDATGTFASTMRINIFSNITGTLIPNGPFSVIGVGSQFKSSAPFNSGYQFLPRSTADIIQASGPVILLPPAETNLQPTSATITWTTQNAGDSKLYYMITDSNYQPTVFRDSIYDPAMVTTHTFNLSNLRPGRIYMMKSKSVNGSGSSSSNNVYFSTVSHPTSTGKIEVYFNKSVDISKAFPGNIANGNTDFSVRLKQRIDSARFSIDFAIYSFDNLTAIRDALINAKIRGVKVRIVYDSRTNQALMQDLINAGFLVQKRNYAASDIMHNKFLIFDHRDSTSYSDDWLWGGSANITSTQFNTDAQNVIIIQDESLCETYQREFEEMWGSHTEINDPARAKFGAIKLDNTPHNFIVGGRKVNQYFSPSDNVSTQIENMIQFNTDRSIYFCAYTFTRFQIANKMRAQFNPPLKLVKGVFDIGDGSSPSSVYPEMSGTGGTTPWNPAAPVLLEHQTGLLHSKYIMIDADMPSSDPIIETGSYNFSSVGTTSNDEEILMIHDSLIVNKYFQDFAQRYEDEGGSVSVQQIGNTIPSAFTLSQNYPNPFNPSTTINFDVPSSGLVTLKIYNTLGMEVATLFENTITPGSYKAVFNASALSSGIYFYKLTQGSLSLTKKMLLVK
ncbi:hypothetical protein BH10BAC5_BH10BAC5_00920 [soil metagenome]